MKSILNNIGAISKQAIVGGAITVATLVVGIGVINNFSSKGNMEQGFASNAIERSGYSYNSAYNGASAEDILSARGYAQGSEGKSTIIGTENLALNRRNSTKTAGVAGVQGEAGEDASLQDDSQGYGDGEIEGMGTSNKVDINVSQEDAALAKAQRDAKIAKGEALTKQAKATLKTSKMADSSGIAGIATGSTSMAFNTGAGSATGANDSSKIALAQAGNLANVNLKGAKDGKLSKMGGSGTAAEGQRLGRSSIGQHAETLGDLKRASKYSRSGKQAVSSDSAKGAADATAAFDGSKEAEAVALDGENVRQAALNALDDSELGTDSITKPMDDIQAQMDKYNELSSKAKKRFVAMLVVSAACFVAAMGVVAAKAGGPWCYLIAGAICIAGAVAIAGTMWGGADSYANAYNEIVQLSESNGGITPGKGELWHPWALYGMLNGLMALGFLGALAPSALPALGLTLGTGVMSLLMSLITTKTPSGSLSGKKGKK